MSFNRSRLRQKIIRKPHRRYLKVKKGWIAGSGTNFTWLTVGKTSDRITLVNRISSSVDNFQNYYYSAANTWLETKTQLKSFFLSTYIATDDLQSTYYLMFMHTMLEVTWSWKFFLPRLSDFFLYKEALRRNAEMLK